MFTMGFKPRLDFSSAANWYNRHIIPAGTSDNAALSTSQIQKGVKRARVEAGVAGPGKKNLHGGRQGFADNAIKGGTSVTELCVAQNREIQNCIKSYISSVPATALMAQVIAHAGDIYFCARTHVAVPVSLRQQVIPWIHESLAHLQTLRIDPDDKTSNVQNSISVCQVLNEFVDIFLTDAIADKQRWPAHPLYNLPVFRTQEWEQFVTSATQEMDAATARVDAYKLATDPLVTLATIQAVKNDVAEVKQMISGLGVGVLQSMAVTPPCSLPTTPITATAATRCNREDEPEHASYIMGDVHTIQDIIVQFLDYNCLSQYDRQIPVLQAYAKWKGKWYKGRPGKKDQKTQYGRRRRIFDWCVAKATQANMGAEPSREQIDAAAAELHAFQQSQSATLRTLDDGFLKKGAPILGVSVSVSKGKKN